MTVTFNDIQAMLASRPVIASPHEELCHGVLQFLDKNAVRLSGEWQEIIRSLSVLGSVQWPQFNHPRVALYASSYGQGDDKVQDRLQKLAQQQDPLTQLCAMVNADLRVYELDLSAPVSATGLSETEACHALSYGLMAVEEHVDCLVVGTLSNGAQAILQKWQETLEKDSSVDAFVCLQQCGAGADLFAMIGAICAARMAKIPVFVTNNQAAMLRLALQRLLPEDVVSHCVAVPNNLDAEDVIQVLQALQNLQFMLALVPQSSNKNKLVMPSAA